MTKSEKETTIHRFEPALLVLIFIPVLSVLVLLLRFGIPVVELSLFGSPWNDELSYYKQIESIFSYGMPRGYYGYNESTALVGTLGPWSPILFLPYALIFKLSGISTFKIIIVNLVLSVVILVGSSMMMKLNARAIIAISLLLISFANFARYLLSISPEILLTLCTILLFSLLYKYELSSDDKYFTACLLLLVFLILARGYYAIYGLAGFFVARGKNKKCITILSVLGAVIGYYLLVHFLCSPFFSPLINEELIRMIWTSPRSFCMSSIDILLKGFSDAFGYVGDIFGEGSMVGAFYLISAMSLLAAFICGAVGKNKTLLLSGICFLLMIISIWLLYDVRTGSRHLMASILAIMMMSMIVITQKNGLHNIIALIITVVIALVTYVGESEYDICPPVKDMAVESAVEETSIDFEFDDDRWNNTVIWTLSCDYRYLYALPAGVGINLCYDNYVIDNCDLLKSKYVAMNLSNDNLILVAEQSDWTLYQTIGAVGIYSTR